MRNGWFEGLVGIGLRILACFLPSLGFGAVRFDSGSSDVVARDDGRPRTEGHLVSAALVARKDLVRDQHAGVVPGRGLVQFADLYPRHPCTTDDQVLVVLPAVMTEKDVEALTRR